MTDSKKSELPDDILNSISSEEKSPNRQYAEKHKQEKMRKERAKVPTQRYLGGIHPTDFIEDVELFMAKHRESMDGKKFKLLDMQQLAFYMLRKEMEPEQSIPAWVKRPKAQKARQ